MTTDSNNLAKAEIALSHLKSVDDPEIGLNIVDLGLIYRIDFDEDKKSILIEMTLTSRFCPMGESITEGVKNAMESAFAGYQPEIKLVYQPEWNVSMISEDGKLFLKY